MKKLILIEGAYPQELINYIDTIFHQLNKKILLKFGDNLSKKDYSEYNINIKGNEVSIFLTQIKLPRYHGDELVLNFIVSIDDEEGGQEAEFRVYEPHEEEITKIVDYIYNNAKNRNESIITKKHLMTEASNEEVFKQINQIIFNSVKELPNLKLFDTINVSRHIIPFAITGSSDNGYIEYSLTSNGEIIDFTIFESSKKPLILQKINLNNIDNTIKSYLGNKMKNENKKITIGDFKKMLTEEKKEKVYTAEDVDKLTYNVASKILELKNAISQHLDGKKSRTITNALSKIYQYVADLSPLKKHKALKENDEFEDYEESTPFIVYYNIDTERDHDNITVWHTSSDGERTYIIDTSFSEMVTDGILNPRNMVETLYRHLIKLPDYKDKDVVVIPYDNRYDNRYRNYRDFIFENKTPNVYKTTAKKLKEGLAVHQDASDKTIDKALEVAEKKKTDVTITEDNTLNIPKISAMNYDGETWWGWSNSGGDKHVTSLQDAVNKVTRDVELGYRIIDADNLVIYISDIKFANNAIKSAKVNFNVDIPLENVVVGLPKTSQITETKKSFLKKFKKDLVK